MGFLVIGVMCLGIIVSALASLVVFVDLLFARHRGMLIQLSSSMAWGTVVIELLLYSSTCLVSKDLVGYGLAIAIALSMNALYLACMGRTQKRMWVK